MVKKNSREITISNIKIGGTNPVVVQSMAATRTTDTNKTIQQINALHDAGAKIVRLAIDSKKDVESLKIIRENTNVALSADLQENYRLIKNIAPYIDKVRYNPGHLHHHERSKSIKDKVSMIVEEANKNNLAIRIGVNCGSVDPVLKEKFDDDVDAMVESASQHCQILENMGFKNYLVSLKDSDYNKVVRANKLFHKNWPQIPLHLGVTEAGMPPDGIIKTRIAFEQLLPLGIGDTIRVSLTLPFEKKYEEIVAGEQIINDINAGRFRSFPEFLKKSTNIISCPSCSRVENETFIELAQDIKKLVKNIDKKLTIAVMGCRVNGPGETDDADIGLWCGPSGVNLKLKKNLIGHFGYDEILPKVQELIENY
ncbi:MAG: (E)-4-hydroxy-3-methylbut-2-enyl-diphosphate synthase [Dehalococcoidia bacterium]